MVEHKAYGYKDANKGSVHGFLFPAVVAALGRLRVPPRSRVVDVGCGNGWVTAQLAEMGHDVVGVDVSADGVEQARAAHPGLRFEVASVYDDDLRAVVGGEADGIVSLEVVEHLFYPKRLFERCHALLRPGGWLVVSTPYHGYWKNLALALTNRWDPHLSVDWDGGHIKFFSEKTLSRMAAAAGFRDIRIQGVGRFPKLWKSMVLTARR